MTAGCCGPPWSMGVVDVRCRLRRPRIHGLLTQQTGSESERELLRSRWRAASLSATRGVGRTAARMQLPGDGQRARSPAHRTAGIWPLLEGGPAADHAGPPRPKPWHRHSYRPRLGGTGTQAFGDLLHHVMRRRWCLYLPAFAIWSFAYDAALHRLTPHMPVLVNWTSSLPYHVARCSSSSSPCATGDLISSSRSQGEGPGALPWPAWPAS